MNASYDPSVESPRSTTRREEDRLTGLAFLSGLIVGALSGALVGASIVGALVAIF